MIAFEPDHDNLGNLKKNFGKDNRVKIIGKGLSDEEKVLIFSPNGSTGCFKQADEKDVSQNLMKIPCTSIDKTSECRDATFIKMDIEGSEMEALMGSFVTIQRNHPKLAICIYHSLEDMVRIVEYVHENYPEYKLYIRQHTADWRETVLYAVYECLL